jgi:hypothetical protein
MGNSERLYRIFCGCGSSESKWHRLLAHLDGKEVVQFPVKPEVCVFVIHPPCPISILLKYGFLLSFISNILLFQADLTVK